MTCKRDQKHGKSNYSADMLSWAWQGYRWKVDVLSWATQSIGYCSCKNQAYLAACLAGR